MWSTYSSAIRVGDVHEHLSIPSQSPPDCPHLYISVSQCEFETHVYQPFLENGMAEISAGGEDGEEEVMAATVADLPCAVWEGLWESLIYAGNIKGKLLNYIYSTLLLSDAGVDCKCHFLHPAVTDQTYP
jgi:hypothetical protein